MDNPIIPAPDKANENINIEEEMQNAYLEYAMSVIVGRALPDVRDGLKPVHRRILYTMHELGKTFDKPYVKSARVVGDVMGKYHPHGDSALYGAMVRMAQDFSQRYTLVDGQGNFGSIDGDSAAAMRYTESRMSRLGGHLLADIEKDTVDFGPNYDGTLTEPKVLPTRIPNLLINGSSGIAVGMSTNVPPHNINEVIRAAIEIMDNPDVSVDDLMKIVPGPDLPTAGIISNISGIRAAYRYGRGSFTMKGRTEIEQFGKDREAIIVTELPYQVNKSTWIEGIANLVRDKEITGISDVRDESNREGIRVVIELKRGEQSQVILNTLYARTQLKTSFGMIMLAIDNGRPKLFNLKELLKAFLDHRKDVVTRRTSFELNKALAKEHILNGLKIAIDNIDEVVEIIKNAPGPIEAKSRLGEKFSLSEKQSQAVLDMRLQKLTGLETKKIVEDLEQIRLFILELKKILASDLVLSEVIKKELNEDLETFGDKRRSEISSADDKGFDVEDFVRDEQVVITITNTGYAKRNQVSEYRSQGRGGKGIRGAGTGSSEDFVKDIFVASTLDSVLCFSNLGKVHVLKAHQIPEMNRTARGRPLVQLLSLAKDEQIMSVLPIKEFKEDQHVVMATAKGVVKKTALSAFSAVRSSGIIALTIDEGDSLITVSLANQDDRVFLATKQGQSITFVESDIRPMGRTARGVRGISLSDDDRLIGMEIISKEQEEGKAYTILTITSKGYGKRTGPEEYRVQGRAGSGIINCKLSDKTGEVVGVIRVRQGDDIMVITDGGQMIRTSAYSVSEFGRAAQGVRVINVSEGEKVQAIAVVRDDETGEVTDAPMAQA
jgi:DNA gyrase subunit A